MSITAAGEATSPRTLHRVGSALVLLLCTSLFVVAGTNAQPASAKIDTTYLERMLKTVPKSAAGGATVVGGTLTGAGLASTAAAAVAGYFVFDASYDATTAVLHWAFDAPETGGGTTGSATSGDWADVSPYDPNPGTVAVRRSTITSGQYAAVETYAPGWLFDFGDNVLPEHYSPIPISVTAPSHASAQGTTFDVCFQSNSSSSTVPWPGSQQPSCRPYQDGTHVPIMPGQTVTYSEAVNDALYFHHAWLVLRGTYVPPTTEAPQHKWRSTVTCPGGGTVTSYSELFREADASIPAIVPPTCPDGMPTALEVYEGDANGDGGTKRVDWTADPAQPFADCLKGGAQYPCSLTLYKITAAGPKDCTGDTIDCTTYDLATSTDADYLCHWGNYTAPLEDCEPLVSAITGPSPGDPLDPTDPIPGTVGAGTTVHNPDGSTTVTQTQTMPDGSTRTVTTTTFPDGRKVITTQPLNPDGTPNGEPSVVNVPAPGTGEQTDSPDGNCMDGAFGWNPLSWVYTPVKCALQWAFVPPPGSLEAAFGGVGDAWNNTAIGTFGGMVGDVFGPIGDLATMEPDGCMGPLVTIPLPVGPDLNIHPLNVCSPLAQMVLGWWMPAASAGIYLATFFGIYHGFGRALGLSTPVVRAKA